MNLNIDLLRVICETPGTSGYEQKIRAVVLEELKQLDVEVSVDNMGNVTALKRGISSAKKVMVGAHMDEIGFIINHIDDKGFLRFHTIGGFDPKTLVAQRVLVHGKKDLVGVMGSKPIHVMSPEERKKMPAISDFYIDLGMDVEEVKKHIEIGNPVTRQRELIEMGDCVNCKSIDNRVSVYILLEALKEMKEIPYDFYGVFTVQEEVGLRGAQVATLAIQPDFGLGLDTTIAFDLPGSKPEERVTALGEGTGIKIMDSSVICDYRMIAYLKSQAIENNIKWQPELLKAGGTDTAGIQQKTPGGSIAGAISIPTRHIHQVIEMAHKSDIRATINLLCKAVENLDKFDWSFK